MLDQLLSNITLVFTDGPGLLELLDIASRVTDPLVFERLVNYNLLNGTVAYLNGTGQNFTAVSGDTLAFFKQDGDLYARCNESIRIVESNILVANGVMHVVERYAIFTFAYSEALAMLTVVNRPCWPPGWIAPPASSPQ